MSKYVCYILSEAWRCGSLLKDGGTDKSKITRKQSKPSKHGHEIRRVNKSRKQSQEKSNPQSNLVNPSIDVIDAILEEDFDALLDEGSKILHSIEGTLLEEEIFAEFDEFMAMTADESPDSESDTEDAPLEKITINTDYKIRTSLEEPPTDLELKPLRDNLEYVFLEEPSFLPVIISAIQRKEKQTHIYSSKAQASLCLENDRHS
ncbi:hypothetical protein Tco_0569558 [Tanacetum coccineum]